MLLTYRDFSIKCFLVVILLIILCAAYAYRVDSRRSADDPKKKNYHPLAILFAPITLPLLIIFSAFIVILRVITYGVFLVFFIFALVFIRQPFILQWLRKTAIGIGDRLMQANTLLIRIFLRPLASYGGST
jgi:hypothetical protein